MTVGGYTCMRCNHFYRHADPEFDYYHRFSERHWAVRAGLVQIGEPMDGRAGTQRETYGWFARCVDRERCEQWRRATSAGHTHAQAELFSSDCFAQ
jgi:hypothetical protein